MVEQIYPATLKLLENKSFGDISVADVLTEASVSRASFYYYFESKFSVLIGLLTRAMDDIFDTVSPFLTRPADVPADEALDRSIRAVTSAWHRHRLVLRATSR